MLKSIALRTLCLLAVLGLQPVLAGTGRGRHKQIFVVPAPGAVTIDAVFDEWDRSGEIEMYVMKETSAMQSALAFMMYDAEALYVGAIVRDTSPMMNMHDPKVAPDRGWDADCLQLYLNVNPDLGHPVKQDQWNPVKRSGLLTMFLWYFTPRKEANLVILEGFSWSGIEYKRGVVPAEKFQAAYRVLEDKKSYALEYRLPWKTLLVDKYGKGPFRGGDETAFLMQFDWGTPDGLATPGVGAWAFDVMHTAGFPAQNSSCWGKANFSKTGNIPRELVEKGAPPEPPMPLSFTYEMPEDGDVSIALVNEEGRQVRHIVAQAPRKAGKVVEMWDGLDDREKPLPAGRYTWKGLYHDPITTKYLLAVHNSGQPSYATPDGTGAWGGDHWNPTTVCAAGKYMLLAWGGGEAGWGLLRTDLNGRRQWGMRAGADLVASNGTRFFTSYHGRPVACLMVKDGRKLLFGRGEDKLEEPEDGPKVGGVSGLACGGGALYVSYANQGVVAKYNAAQGTLLEKWSVPAPRALAVFSNGSVAVASDGEILRIVKDKVERFTGRKANKLGAVLLDSPTSLAIDAKDRLYVANRGALQNVSVFAPNGHYLHSIGIRGGRPRVGRYEKQGMLEPGGIAIGANGRLWVAETLDGPRRHSVWNVETGKLENEFFGGSEYSTHPSMDPKNPDELFCHNVIWEVDLDKGTWRPKSTLWRSAHPNSPQEPGGGNQAYCNVFTARDGRQYALGYRIAVGVTLYERRGDIFVPIKARIGNGDGRPRFEWPAYPIFGDETKYRKGASFAWEDANDDQIIQENEIKPSSEGFTWEGGEDLITDYAQSMYGFNDPSDGARYQIRQDRPTRKTTGGIVRLKPDGKTVEWRYARKWADWIAACTLPISKPGEMYGIQFPMGSAGDYLAFAAYFGPVHILTRDGMYVAQVFKDSRLGEFGPDVLNCESYQGRFIREERKGRYLLLIGDTDGRVTQVNGLETVKRMPGGTYEITENDVKTARAARAKYEQLLKGGAEKVLTIAPGGRAGLEKAEPAVREVDATRSFTARLAYDATTLYVSYTVRSPNELVNSIPEMQTIFKGGNCLDIQLATDPKADPKRTKPAPGDIRLLVTRQKGRAAAVLYRPKVAGFKGEPIVFKTSPARESFHEISIVSNRVSILEYAAKRGEFTVVAAIPLDLLGWTPKTGTQVKLDVGYLYGNTTGNRIARRAYWANNSFTSNVTDDVPHESRLEPAQWGWATVE